MDELGVQPVETKKKKPISVGFLLVVLALGGTAYFAGPYIMTYAMLLQERAKANGPAVERPSTGERPSFPAAGNP